MDFSSFKAVTSTAKTRKSTKTGLPTKVQEYDDLKYRKTLTEKGEVKSIVPLFTVSNKRFSELGLEALQLSDFVNPADKSQVLLTVVSKEDGKYLRAREGKKKGKSFKSEALEAALNAAGIIDSSDAAIGAKQYLKIEQVGENVTIDGVNVIKAFLISKGEAKPKPVKVEKEVVAPTGEAKEETKEVTEATPAPVADAPAASGDAPAAAAGSTDWD